MNSLIVGYFFRLFHWPLTLSYVQTREDRGTSFLALFRFLHSRKSFHISLSF